MPFNDPDVQRDYQRRLMRWRRLWSRVKGRYLRYADDRGLVPVCVLEVFSLWGQSFTPGEMRHIHPHLAARLELAGLVEVCRPPRRPRHGAIHGAKDAAEGGRT